MTRKSPNQSSEIVDITINHFQLSWIRFVGAFQTIIALLLSLVSFALDNQEIKNRIFLE